MLSRWTRGIGRISGWMLLIVPVVAIIQWVIFAIIIETTCEQGGCNDALLFTLLGGLMLLSLIELWALALSIGTLFGRSGRARAARHLALQILPRLQSAKDWLIRGEISEEEYARMETAYKPLVEGSTPSQQARMHGSVALWASIIMLLPTFFLVIFSFIAVDELSSPYGSREDLVFGLFFVSVALVDVVILVWMFILAGSLKSQTRGLPASDAAAAEQVARSRRRPPRTGTPGRRRADDAALWSLKP
jgi:uncharacterized membrane protein